MTGHLRPWSRDSIAITMVVRYMGKIMFSTWVWLSYNYSEISLKSINNLKKAQCHYEWIFRCEYNICFVKRICIYIKAWECKKTFIAASDCQWDLQIRKILTQETLRLELSFSPISDSNHGDGTIWYTESRLQLELLFITSQ